MNVRSRLLWFLGGVVSVLVIITAVVVFTSDDDGDDVATGSSTTSTETTTPASSSTTADDRDADEEDDDGDGTTTTVVPAAAPVIVADGYVLGYFDADGDAWISLSTDDERDPLPDPLVAGGETYRFLDLDGIDEVRPLGPVIEYCYLGINHGVDEDAGLGQVGIPAGGIDPFPRGVEVIGASPAHVDAVGVWLEEQGVAEPDPRIDRVTRFDVEGDGRFEVLIEASKDAHGQGTNEAGAYSVVLYRYVDDDEQVQTVEIGGDVVTQDEVDEQGEFQIVFVYEVLAVADLSGDGVFEIVTKGWFYEGESVEVLDVFEGTLTPVLGTGCGA